MYGIHINETATFSWDPYKLDPNECMRHIQMKQSLLMPVLLSFCFIYK